MNDSVFDYETFVTRNLGFVTKAEQDRLKKAHVFVAGVGGMGGTVVSCLARAGVGAFTIADPDRFELSNLNRQMFANLDVLGQSKAQTVQHALLRINPECKVEVAPNWVHELDSLLPKVSVVVNGCDDIRATLALMRQARQHQKTVVDAFASTLPNVLVVRPGDPRPENVLGYPSVGKSIAELDDATVALCAQKEMEWVLTASSTARYVDLDIAGEMVRKERPRISFAPMVWMTGCLMAYEAIRVILSKPGGPGPGGVFWNPWTHKVETAPMGPWRALRGALVRRFLNKLAHGTQ